MIIKMIDKLISKYNIIKIKLLHGKNVEIGKNVNIRGKINIRIGKGAKLIIKDNCFFNNNCSINVKEKVEIYENTILGENVKIYDHNHIFNLKNKLIKDSGYKQEKIVIGKNCWICSDVTILKGIKIGDNCVIATKEIVEKDIDSGHLLKNKLITKIEYK